MACSCRNRQKDKVDTPHIIQPEQPCVFCAQKHFSTAMQLAREYGYETPNRQAVIGQLILAQWHLYRNHYPIAEKIRDIRHYIEQRKQSEITNWTEVAQDIAKTIQDTLTQKPSQQTTA